MVIHRSTSPSPLSRRLVILLVVALACLTERAAVTQVAENGLRVVQEVVSEAVANSLQDLNDRS